MRSSNRIEFITSNKIKRITKEEEKFEMGKLSWERSMLR